MIHLDILRFPNGFTFGPWVSETDGIWAVNTLLVLEILLYHRISIPTGVFGSDGFR